VGPGDTGVVPITVVSDRYWLLQYQSGSSGNQLHAFELLSAEPPVGSPIKPVGSGGIRAFDMRRVSIR
jgi:hypothetical protein